MSDRKITIMEAEAMRILTTMVGGHYRMALDRSEQRLGVICLQCEQSAKLAKDIVHADTCSLKPLERKVHWP